MVGVSAFSFRKNEPWSRLGGPFFFLDTERRAARAWRSFSFLKSNISEADIRSTLACDVVREHAITASELLAEV